MSVLLDNLTIRRARDSDLPEMARIHFASYPGIPMSLEERIGHFREDPRLSLEGNWICERAGHLIGLFALYNFQMYRSGSISPAGGIGRVAVAPEARMEKTAYWMMAEAVRIMDQNGVPVSILYPFRHGFYRKLGWGLAGRVKLYHIPPTSIPLYSEREGVTPASTREEFEEIMVCYHRFANESSGLLVRDDPVWYEHVLKNHLAYMIRGESGTVDGYLIYKYRPQSSSKAFMRSDLVIREMVYTTNHSLRGILGFLSSQRDQIESIEYYDHYDLPLEQILSEPLMTDGKRNIRLGAETAWIGSGLMARIVQLRRVLAAGGLGRGDGTVTFKIKDELNPENSAPLIVEIHDGKVEFLKQTSQGLTLATDMATFSSIYWGALTLSDALYFGKVEMEGRGDASFLHDSFSFPRSVCLDYF